MKKLTLLLAILFPVLCLADGVAKRKKSNELIQLGGPTIQVFEDESGSLSVTDVLSRQFKVNEKVTPNLGVSASVFWLKFSVRNVNEENMFLKLAYPNLDEVELYEVTSEIHLLSSTGKNEKFFERNHNDPGYIFDLNLKKEMSGTYLMKIRSGGQIMAPLYIGNEKAVLESTRRENLFVGIYIGLILIMFLYNIFIYFTVKDRVYLYYVGYILVVGLVQLCLLGYTFQFFWPGSTWLAKHSLYILSALIGLAAIEFIKVFLDTKKYVPSLHKGFHILTAIYILYIILDIINLSAVFYNVIQGCAMILSFYMLFVANKIRKKGNRSAKFFLYAWSIFLVGVFVYALKDVGILPYNTYTVYLMPVGSAIEAALISFALADKINVLTKEKEESQLKSLSLLQENERIIREQAHVLELKVKERTAELEATNRSLKEAEAHLVNVEKMASLGQLTAGISHEINNPINFVLANVKPLKRDIDEILEVMDKYGEIKSGENLEQKLEVIKELKDKLDLDYVIEEINMLLKGIDEGANRTAEIVKGLKNFSRSDEISHSICDIHEGMDVTISILNNHIVGEKIKVTKKYGKLPQIECYPGKLNQVFMNLLSNSVHAIGSKQYTQGEGEIIITTSVMEHGVQVSIKDNGIGISKANQSKVFEPFFTTKEVGMGTGLGLSIVYGIIKSHGGEITIISEEGMGAEFIIKLPFTPPSSVHEGNFYRV
ncbi:MAG: pgtB [Bacteroidetes bacterium]|jgi:signal transduction histidine kinase|nr:pgtB [Bacteroidota bacterium]